MAKIWIIAIITLFIGLAIGSIIGYLLAPPPITLTTTIVTTKVVYATSPSAATTTTKQPIVQLASATDKPNMAIVVMTSLVEDIPANTIIKIRVVDKNGGLIYEGVSTIEKSMPWYEFVIPLEKNRQICQGRPLFVHVTIETPIDKYEYRGELPEWKGIEDMYLPFSR